MREVAIKLFVRGPYLGFRMLLLAALSIALMVFDHHNVYLPNVRSKLNNLTAPLQYFVSIPSRVVATLESELSSRIVLTAENQKLRGQLLLLRGQLQKFTALQQENLQLRALLQSYPRASDRVLVAELLSVSSDPYIQEVVLNRGTEAGVFEGQPVLDANGVLGQVISLGDMTSRVLLISDPRSGIPVEDSRNGLRGVVVGTGEVATLSLTNVPLTSDIQVGDTLVTSGLGGVYPMGYPVGTVESVSKNDGQAFDNIVVKPAAQVDRSRLVLLIWPNLSVQTIQSIAPKVISKTATSAEKNKIPDENISKKKSKKAKAFAGNSNNDEN